MHQPIPHTNVHNDYQKFRPRYPIDPFQDGLDNPSAHFDQQQVTKEPWRLDFDKLPPVELTKLCRTVMLILGGQFSFLRLSHNTLTPRLQNHLPNT
jgi:hypothetical protein